jgi:DNA-directed RNA polymerases I, II, and III subunit RPABC2
MDINDSIKETDFLSYNETIQNIEKNKRISRPFLSKFERAKLIGIRIQQLSSGFQTDAPINIIGNKLYDIANYEINEKKLPYIVRRYFPNNKFEDWKLEELN